MSEKDFFYNEELDQFECTQGNKAILPFRKIKWSHDKHGMRVYRSNNSKCKDCPLRSTCIGKSDFKKIEHSIHKPLYDAMHEKLQTAYAKRIFKKRGSTEEPVLGTMLNFLNLNRVNMRGIKQANKHCLMSALTYNLKKYLKFTSNKWIPACIQLEKSGILTNGVTFSTFFILKPTHMQKYFHLLIPSIKGNKGKF